ncbi:MAG: hypothetical protein OXF79_20885 [Chloroflexi bacterium]|nr:hypothetical protein [Chloroflexota bacterium]
MFSALMSSTLSPDFTDYLGLLIMFAVLSPLCLLLGLLLGLIVGWVCHHFMDVPLGRAMGAGTLSGAAYGLFAFMFLVSLDEISFTTFFVGIPVVSILAAGFACWMLDRDDEYTSNTEVAATGGH